MNILLLLIPLVYSQKIRLTPAELSDFNGHNGKVYIACGGLIFDVSDSPSYQKGGSYWMFGGKDASVSLAKYSFKEEYLTMRPEEANLTPNEIESIEHWKSFYSDKYPIVGELYYPSGKEDNL